MQHISHSSHEQSALWTKDFVCIVLINGLMFLGFQCYPAALPPYLKTLGAGDDMIGLLTAFGAIPALLTRPLAGVLLDRLGRRGVFLNGLAVMTLVSAALYFFPVVGIILLLRFVHGLAWGVASTSATTVATDAVPKQRLGEGMGFFSLSVGLAMAISPAIALSLSPKFMFILATGFMTAATVLAFPLHYRTASPATGNRKLFPFEKTAIRPAVVMFLANSAYGAVLSFLAVYAAQRGIQNIGPYFTVYALVLMLTRPNIGRLVDKKGCKAALLPGLFCLSAALLMLSQSTNLAMFLASAVLYGIGQGATHTSAQTLAVLYAPEDRVGTANATFFIGFDGGIGVGALLAGFLAGHFGYPTMYLSLMALPLLAALIFYLAHPGHDKPDRP